MRSEINLVWFKRDLRLSDHQPLKNAFNSDLPALLIYNFEPLLLDDPHYNQRHWRFVYQSIRDMNEQLIRFNTQIYIFNCSMQSLIEALTQQFVINTLFSHQEIGLNNTFTRDKAIQRQCHELQINWQESPTGAVIRGKKNRHQWNEKWQQTMQSPLATPNWKIATFIKLNNYVPPVLPTSFYETDELFQQGGARLAQNVMTSFLSQRGQGYQRGISSPSLSQTHFSRLSAHLAWGNLSLRQVNQATITAYQQQKSDWKRPLAAFISRLHWHCHFMQKFESQPDMEYLAVNSGYYSFPYRCDDNVASDLACFIEGQTGIPIIDACMRCLKHT
ncbi:MAG: deoxyribodipyrimidine photo-lyase, partial [Pseudoalteromonas sp.]